VLVQRTVSPTFTAAVAGLNWSPPVKTLPSALMLAAGCWAVWAPAGAEASTAVAAKATIAHRRRTQLFGRLLIRLNIRRNRAKGLPSAQ
jgi:hypothetical protein